MNPMISFFIPVYNGERYLADALESLRSQSFQDFEIIVVDDGSSDRTLQIALEYTLKDSRIRTVSHGENFGLSAARNTGWRVANPSARYIMNHDSDDISLPAKLEKLLKFLEEHPRIAAVGSFAEYFDDNGATLGSPPIEWKPSRIRSTFGKFNSMLISATLVRREMMEKVAPFRPEYKGCDDYDFWSRALLQGYNLCNIPEVLHRIRLHPQSIGAMRKEEMEKLAEKIRHEYMSQQRAPGIQRIRRLFGL